MITSLNSVQQVQESPTREGSSEVHKRPVSEVVWNTSTLKKVCLSQQSYNAPIGMPYCEEEKGEKKSQDYWSNINWY